MTPQAWLAERPLQTGERLYLIVSAASNAEALKTLYQNEPTTQAIPIWGGTPYAAWQPVMPYLTELKPNSSFLPWIAETDALDWGVAGRFQQRTERGVRASAQPHAGSDAGWD